jgi:ligand-binding sensor domain-containing protein
VKTFFFILILFFVGFLVPIAAQENNKFFTYGISQGLSQSSVRTVFQDRKGFLWFGTDDGLNKFDGYKFTIYKSDPADSTSISDNEILEIILEDSDGELWMVTNDRVINRFNPVYQQFTRYYDQDINNNNPVVYFIFEDSYKNIWISNHSGLRRFNKKKNIIASCHKYTGDVRNNLQKHITKVIEDKKGNVWFASRNGLLKYNLAKGQFKWYLHNAGDKTSISGNEVTGFYIDNAHSLWVLTINGLSKYNDEIDDFTSYILYPEGLDGVVKNTDCFVLESDPGIFWVGTSLGLYRVIPRKGSIRRFLNEKGDKFSISNNEITCIFKDGKKNFWFGTANGLNLYSNSFGGFEHFFMNVHETHSSYIYQIIEDRSGKLWALDKPNQHNGSFLSEVYTENKELVPVLQTMQNKFSPGNFHTNCFSSPWEDRTGNIWFGTFDEGVIKYAPDNKKFESYGSFNVPGFAANKFAVFGLCEDDRGKIWLAVLDKGLACFDPQDRTFPKMMVQLENPYRLPLNDIVSVMSGKPGVIWISTMKNGLIKYDYKNNRFKQFINQPGNINSITSNFLRDTYTDKKGQIWICTLKSGVDLFDPVTEKFSHFRHQDDNYNSLSNNNVWTVREDHLGEIWFATDGCIDRYSPTSGKFIHYKSKSPDSTGINVYRTFCIHESAIGDMWFGTSGGGIALFDRKTGKFNYWTEKDGLPNNTVYAILEDDKYNLWISTNNGLSKFSRVSNAFRNYDVTNGLQSNEFNSCSYLKTRDGKMYFGGIDGFNSFYPSDITIDTILPTTVVTGLQIFNKEVSVIPAQKTRGVKVSGTQIVHIGNTYYLPRDISYTTEITLTYREKVITFEFAALHFDHPEKTKYQYILKNFEKDWNYAGTRGFASYTNLPPGKYVFQVTAANSDGNWNPLPTEINLIILPPFWRAWWFLVLEFLIVSTSIVFFIKRRERLLKHEKEQLELKVIKRTNEIKIKNEELLLRNELIVKQKEEIQLQAERLKAELVSHNKLSEQALLRMQVNPHFLFNTLNNIYSLVYQKLDTAPAAVVKLSEIMRYMLYDSTSDLVPLEQEIKYLRSYIELQALRLQDSKFVDFDVMGDTNGLTIAPMLLIPFIENAFKHGAKRVTSPGIIIHLIVGQGLLNFEVTNHRKPNLIETKDQTGGIGLQNVRRRLELLYPSKHLLEINLDKEICVVKLKIEMGQQ